MGRVTSQILALFLFYMGYSSSLLNRPVRESAGKIFLIMTFSEAVKTCLVDKYATFSGRATRSEYWFLVLFGYLLAFIIVFVGMSVESPELMIGLSIVLGLILFIPSLSVCVRRLHDTGRSGWWYLLILIPYVGGIALFIIFCLKSDNDNKYGPKP